MKRKPLSLLALLLSASLAFSGCELDTSTSSASSTSTKSETSIATTVSETEGSTAPFGTSFVIEETTTSSTETTTPISTTSCSSVDDMKESNKAFTNDYDQAIADGYKPCGRCKP